MKCWQMILHRSNKKYLYCDIDGTVNDHYLRIRRWAVGENPPRTINSRAFLPIEVRKDEVAFDSVYWINKIKDEGFQIHWITARPRSLKRTTREWLKRNGFPVDSITHIVTEEKPEFLRKRLVDIYVDDLKKDYQNDQTIYYDSVINKCTTYKIPLILFDNNWEHIYDICKSMKEK